MKKRNPIQSVGIAIFIVGFAAFVYMLTASKYRFTQEMADKFVGTDEKGQAFNNNADGFLDTEYPNPFAFSSALEEALQKANNALYETNKIDEAAVADKVSAQIGEAKKLEAETLETSLKGLTEVQSKQIKDYGGWVTGRDYETKELLMNDFKGVLANVNASFKNGYGFKDYEIKSLRYTAAKAASYGPLKESGMLYFWLSVGVAILGSFLYIAPKFNSFPGIKNDGIFFSGMKSRGVLGILTGTFLIAFYVCLYWYPEYIVNWVIMVDPISRAFNGGEASQWFLYGLMYCLSMIVMGTRMVSKYRHSPYQLMRTGSVVFFQITFAFLIPEILARMSLPSMDFKNMWPLDYSFFFDYRLDKLLASGGLGVFMLGWGIALFVVGVPVMTYFFGKRWYCSWVCGCGGLAETLGDPYRQLSDKSLKAWKIERYLIHGVLVFAVIMTGFTLYTYFTGQQSLFGLPTWMLQKQYGFWIGATFSGVVGTGFYPLMGNRTWCRFGCPLAAYLGLVQKYKSRFRITTNGGQCISCGNCSTHCEMGIDVRSYAQRGQNIVRSSCVGCGVCSSVCPRGVLNLENADSDNRMEAPAIIIGRDRIELAN